MTSKTLRSSLAGAVAKSALLTSVVAAGLTLCPMTQGVQVDALPAPTETLAEALSAKHGCWTGEAPSDVTLPGHVVVTVKGQTRYAGQRLTGKALDQIFGGHDHGLTIHAFCR